MQHCDEIKIQYVNAKILIPSEYNPRKASEKQHAELTESIKRFGICDPIIVNSSDERKNIVIGGHFRLRVCTDMGIEMVPVVYVNVPDIKKEQELNIRLNKNSGEFDYDLLANIDQEILNDVGFDSSELDKLFGIEEEEKKMDNNDAMIRKTDDILNMLYCLNASLDDIKHLLSCMLSEQEGGPVDEKTYIDGKPIT
jgi:ParB-like chromosome segregation protein Spo0J